MVSLLFALQRPGNTMNNTIDDVDYVINWIIFIIIIQYVTNSCHSHSIVNEPFLRFNINSLLFGVGSNTMKNNMFKNPANFPENCRLNGHTTPLRPLSGL